jgi:hypothetical protein
MGLFVNNSDFTDKFELHTGMFDTQKLTEYIDRYEEIYLNELLGIKLYNDFKADLVAGVPQNASYVFIFNEFKYETDIRLIISRGMKDMLIGFIYFEFMKDKVAQNTSVGMTKPRNENSGVVSAHNPIYLRYNEAVKTYKAIQDYIMLNLGNVKYEKFRGYNKMYAYWI